MGYSWLCAFLLAGTLCADPPQFVIATAAGYIPGATPVALQQHLIQPVFVAYDPNGTLYYGTTHQIWRLNPDATATLVAGNGASDPNHLGDGGVATEASLTWVAGLGIDAQHNIYISDLFAGEIRKVTPAGMINRFAGTGATPVNGAGSNASAAIPAQKVALTPGPLALDTNTLYMSDITTASVLAFTLDGRNSRVVAGNHGSQSAGDGGLATNAGLFYPGTLAMGNGILYINEARGARIRQVNFRSGLISTLVTFPQTFLTDNGNQGLAADPDGTLYLQRGNSITRLYPNSTTPQPFAGGGNSNPGDSVLALDATLLSPVSLAVNPISHDLALADCNGNLIQTVSPSTSSIQTVAGLVHFAGDNGPAPMAIFNGMEGVVADAQGNLYVADTGNNRIRKIDATGIVTTVAGTGTPSFSGDNGPATSAALNLKHAPPFANNLAIDSAGNLYVSDYGNGRIRKIDTSGVITTVAGGGQSPIARGGIATATALQPGPLAVDASGNVYFGNVLSTAATAISTVYKVDGTGKLFPWAGIASSAKPPETGTAISMPMGYAYCLIAGPLDTFYICDSVNNRVRAVSPAGIMTTIAGNGNIPNGPIQAGPPTATAIGSPTALAIDATGNLFVYSLRQVTVIDNTGTLQPFAGINTTPMTSAGDGGPASQASFTSIAGMTFDASGALYLSDGGVYLREALPVGANGPPPIISAGGIIGAGASDPPVQAVSPGAIVSIFGANFSPPGAEAMLQASDLLSGKIPTSLAGICVSFGGVNAPITGVFPNQINVLVPALPPGPTTVKVTSNCGGTSPIAGNLSAVAVGAASPEFFTSRNDVAATITGDLVEAYGTGWGATTPAIPPGSIPGMVAPLVRMPVLLLGGAPVPSTNILYAGASPCCAGLYQIDFTLPPGTPTGKLPIVISVSGVPSPPNAYLTVPPSP